MLYGETADGAWFNDLKKRKIDITDMRETLIFGQAYQGEGRRWTLWRPLQRCPMTQRSAAATACARARSRA